MGWGWMGRGGHMITAKMILEYPSKMLTLFGAVVCAKYKYISVITAVHTNKQKLFCDDL